MRVLYAAHFDPAGVMAGHRAALRAAGVEAYLAMNVDYRVEGADKAVPPPDVVVVCPGIGTGASHGDPALRTDVLVPLPSEVEQILALFPRAKRVAYFHGSVNTWALRDSYAIQYRARGFALAASTLDYAVAMDAAYLPPALPVVGPRADLRPAWRPLHVAHTPTNPRICHSREFLDLAIDLGVPVRFVTAVSQAEALNVKRVSHAVFDHLRGAFSVNSLEAAALGTIPLFGLTSVARARLTDEGFTSPPGALNGVEDLRRILGSLRDDVPRTVALQQESFMWAQQFNPAATAQRLVAFYESLP